MPTGQEPEFGIPVKMFWKASSTLLASRAEVSMKDRWFSPVIKKNHWLVLARSRGQQQHRHTSKRLGFLRRNGPQMAQITLVTDKHNHNVGVSVIAQLLEPSRNILVGLMLADIVDEEGADSASVVRRGNCTVSFLTSSIPNLCLDSLGVNLNGARGEFDTDGGLGVEVELVAGESTEKVGFTNTGVSDQDD